jgi:tetraacyldisaccharide 4'-kinase
VHAVAGIGHPERFFETLRGLGIEARARAFQDHHVYVPEDLPQGVVLMTEKDAVKCVGLGRDDLWALGVDARVDDGLQSLILAKLKTQHGQ